ncbi:hypothetical protein D3C78_1323570 [compost metagenome]
MAEARLQQLAGLAHRPLQLPGFGAAGEQAPLALEPVEIARQLAAAVPAQVFVQPRIQPGALPGVEAQVVVQLPGDQPVEVAIDQLHAAAGRQHQQREQQAERPGG